MEEDALSSWGFLRGCLSQGTTIAVLLLLMATEINNREKKNIALIYNIKDKRLISCTETQLRLRREGEAAPSDRQLVSVSLERIRQSETLSGENDMD